MDNDALRINPFWRELEKQRYKSKPVSYNLANMLLGIQTQDWQPYIYIRIGVITAAWTLCLKLSRLSVGAA